MQQFIAELFTSRKTTLAGVLGLVLVLGADRFGTDPATAAKLKEAGVAVLAGGLVMARDNNVTSEQAIRSKAKAKPKAR